MKAQRGVFPRTVWRAKLLGGRQEEQEMPCKKKSPCQRTFDDFSKFSRQIYDLHKFHNWVDASR